MNIALKVTMFNNPSEFFFSSMVTKGTDYETTVAKNHEAQGLTCPVGVCERWITFELRPDQFQHSGLQELRFRAFADTPDGNRMTASINLQLYVENGQSEDTVARYPFFRGKGWYTDFEYCEGGFLSVPVPEVVSGTWQPSVRVVDHDASQPVSGYSVHIDPHFHEGHGGLVVVSGAGQLPTNALSIDTTRLANGFHRLVIKADCATPVGSTNSGLAVIGFVVTN
jgi:hypothetical protein